MFANPDSPRFLICRLSAVGDCVHTLPVATALRERYPDAHIAWVTQQMIADMLDGQRAIDQWITVSPRYLRTPGELWRLRRQLKELRFDVTIDPQSLTKSAAAGWLSGAYAHRLHRSRGRELALWMNNRRVVSQQSHVVDRYLETLIPLGIVQPDVRFDLPVQPAARDSVGRALDSMGLKQFAVVNPGAGWGSKVWPSARYGDVAAHLGSRHSLPSLVVWAGEQERQWAQTIVSHSGGHARIAPQTTLAELAALVGQARLFVGSDTGPLHMAAAAGTSCVGLYGDTLPEVCGPYGPGHVALRAKDGGDGKMRRDEDNTAMQAIAVDEVCAACDEVVSANSNRDQKAA